jgi:hypothetical protein
LEVAYTMTDKVLKDRFSISADELESRMQRQEKYHTQPIQKAVSILEMALDTVMKKLGVDVTQDIPSQQKELGIIITEETRVEMGGLNGFFVSIAGRGEIVPYAWIGEAKLNSVGECSCEIHWFKDERMDEIGGVKLQ